MSTVVDDMSSLELSHTNLNVRAGQALYLYGINGQYNNIKQTQNWYVMPPGGGGKDSSVIASELFLDCLRELETSTTIKMTTFDCGPLNRAQEVRLLIPSSDSEVIPSGENSAVSLPPPEGHSVVDGVPPLLLLGPAARKLR